MITICMLSAAGLVGNAVLLAHVIVDDPSSLLWVAGPPAVGRGGYPP